MKDTNKQVKNTPFPSVTICTEGINMDAVMEAFNEDFNSWMIDRKNSTSTAAAQDRYTEEEHRANYKAFLYDIFSINSTTNISIKVIALAYLSPDPDK